MTLPYLLPTWLGALLAGGTAGAIYGLLEATFLLLVFSPNPTLDLGLVPLATTLYGMAGAGCGLGLRLVRTVRLPGTHRDGGSAILQIFLLALALWLALGTAFLVARRGFGTGLVSWQAALSGLLSLLLFGALLRGVARRITGTVAAGHARRWLALLVGVLALGLVGPLLVETASGIRTAPRRAAVAAVQDRSDPPLILITLDTTRPDHLGLYGYERNTSPNLDRFAETATVYDEAWASSSWTLPTHATLFTGMFPWTHGAHYMGTQSDEPGTLRLGSGEQAPLVRQLDPAFRTLAEVLVDHGYATGAVTGGPYLDHVFGTGQGFDWYDDQLGVSVAPYTLLYGLLNRFAEVEPNLARFQHGYRRASEVNRAAFSWLSEHGDRPFFLFLNYFDAHEPYWAPSPWREQWGNWRSGVGKEQLREVFYEVIAGNRGLTEEELGFLVAQYDAEIAFMDHHLGAFFDYLHDHDLFDRSMIVITADHGENLGEHGLLSHGFDLFAASTRIPLLVKMPGQTEHARLGHPVSQADLLPTVLAEFGIEPLQAGIAGQLHGTRFDDRSEHTVIGQLHPDPWRIARFGERWDRTLFTWMEGGLRSHEGSDQNRLYSPLSDRLELLPLDDPTALRELLASADAWRSARPIFQPSVELQETGAQTATVGGLEETGYAGGAED